MMLQQKQHKQVKILQGPNFVSMQSRIVLKAQKLMAYLG